MQWLLAFLLGVASSGAVSWVVYRRQRRESLRAEGELLRQLAGQGELLGIAASTGLVAVGSTARLERDVSVLRRQVAAALNPDETIRQNHLDLARRVLPANGSLDERTIKELHGLLLGEELEYAGQFRDVPIRVGGAMLEPDGLTLVPEPAQLRDRLASVLQAWERPITGGVALSREQQVDRILRFHVGLLQVHPFFDGNGLLARVLLAFQTEQLLGTKVLLPRRDGNYFACLRRASEGNWKDLLAYVK